MVKPSPKPARWSLHFGLLIPCAVVPWAVLPALVPLCASAEESKKIVGVLEFRNQAKLSDYEIGTVTDMLRIAAREKLPEREYIVMTRENMVKLLPPGKDLSTCVEAECEVEVGRQIGADYVVAGEVGRFGSALQVKMKLYDTRTGDLLSGQIAEAGDVDGLKEGINNKAMALFSRLIARASPAKGEWTPDAGEMAIVRFTSEPEGAVLLLDGNVLCQKLPCSKAVVVGLHEVSVQMEKFLPKTERVEIKKGSSFSYTLESNVGWLTVRSKPDGLNVKVDREERGSTPVVRLELVAKAYEVSSTGPCHEDITENVVVERGKVKEIILVPKNRVGAVNVTAEDQNGDALEAAVFVDGGSVGNAPGTFRVPVCSRQIEVRHGESVVRQALGIKEKDIEKVVARFEVTAQKPRPVVSPRKSERKGVEAKATALPPGEKAEKKEKLSSIGLVAGANWAYFNSASDFKPGFVGGLALDCGVSRYFSIRPGVLFSMKGNDHFDVPSGNTYTYSLDYAELSVLAKVSLPLGVFVPEFFAGPYVGNLSSASKDGPGGTTEELRMFNKVDFGFVFGTGFRLDFADWAVPVGFDYSRGVVPLLAEGDKFNNALALKGGVALKF